MKFFLFAAGVAVVSAKCANDCSSHGDCNAKNQCECYRNYFGPDCSQRLCPAGRAFIDSAVGDLNGDNSVGVDLVYANGRAVTPVSEVFSYQYGQGRDSFDVTSAWNEAHFYQECSSKGVCDTSTGECACFPGYEGSGCARKSCENDCSGHGACKNYAGTAYNMWDVDSTLYCDCDAGYTGPGCEQRVCPSGVDPVQASNLDTSQFYQIGFRSLSTVGGDFTTATFEQVPFGPVTWTITLTDEYGDEWTTSLLTTNYDVIEDTGGGAPLYSVPIIAGGADDGTGNSETVEAFEVPTVWNSFGDDSLHVADQVKTALEALPNKAAGTVTVHELYTLPNSATATISLLSERFPEPFTGDAAVAMAWPVLCGRYDIYADSASVTADGAGVGVTQAGIIGCGVAVVDTQLGSGACTDGDRAGNNDIEDFLGSTGAYAAGGFTALVDGAVDPLFISGVDGAGGEVVTSALAADQTLVSVPAAPAIGGSFVLFEIATAGTVPAESAAIYYQYPHFSNGDGADARFPLFVDLVEDCTTPTVAFYDTGANYHADNLALVDGSIPGLSLFLYFTESTIETAPRVDFSFNNKAADAYLGTQIFSAVGIGEGETIEGTSGGTGDYASHALVEVADKGGDRVWDVAFHGRQAYFLNDGTTTSTDVTNHMCSKRGLCDYSTGLCDCFSGFTGANCAEQNALAY